MMRPLVLLAALLAGCVGTASSGGCLSVNSNIVDAQRPPAWYTDGGVWR